MQRCTPHYPEQLAGCSRATKQQYRTAY